MDSMNMRVSLTQNNDELASLEILLQYARSAIGRRSITSQMAVDFLRLAITGSFEASYTRASQDRIGNFLIRLLSSQ